MLLRLFVVVDAHEEYVASVFGSLRGIFLCLFWSIGMPKGIIEYKKKKTSYFLVWNVALLFFFVVRQVSKMYQHCEDIVLAPDYSHVITEFGGIDINMLSRQHAYDVILQSVEIHLNVGIDRIVGSRGCAVAFANSTL